MFQVFSFLLSCLHISILTCTSHIRPYYIIRKAPPTGVLWKCLSSVTQWRMETEWPHMLWQDAHCDLIRLSASTQLWSNYSTNTHPHHTQSRFLAPVTVSTCITDCWVVASTSIIPLFLDLLVHFHSLVLSMLLSVLLLHNANQEQAPCDK